MIPYREASLPLPAAPPGAAPRGAPGSAFCWQPSGISGNMKSERVVPTEGALSRSKGEHAPLPTVRKAQDR